MESIHLKRRKLKSLQPLILVCWNVRNGCWTLNLHGSTKFLPDFLKHNYLLQKVKFRDARNIGVTVQDGRHLFKYEVQVPKMAQYVDVVVEAGVPIEVTMGLSNLENPMTVKKN
jgi:hypothetical protein